MVKPSKKEEEYFAKQMFEEKQRIEQEKQQKLAVAERRKAKELHFMKCPKGGMKKLSPVHSGEVLLEEFLKPMGLSQNRLALGIGVPPTP